MSLDNYKKILGQKIHVKMDRKMGERHPKYNFIYPVNYGYIPNTISEDGEEIDVYINIDEDNCINTLKKVGAFFITLEKVFKDKKDWDKKLKTYAAEHLADLATELRKNSKSLFKFLKVWRWYFVAKMKLVSLAIENDGEIVATFDDRKLFLGHKIIVKANTNSNEINSATVENFNIEDYKKIEVLENNIEIKENKEE